MTPRGRGAGRGTLTPGGKAHLLIQTHEAQGVAGTLHLVQNVKVEHHGCEGDVEGAVAACRDDLVGTQ